MGMTSKLSSCFDFRLRSEIPLPELHDAPAGEDGAIVDIKMAPVPEELSGAAAPAWGLQRAGDAALLTVEGVARYLVDGGRSITVEPTPEASGRKVRLFLLGSALGILCHQRGLLPLHANTIVAGGSGYAFAGHSGAGKSTLAGYFARAGFEVLGDDVCAVRLDDEGHPWILPGLPRIKLWADAATALGHDPTRLERITEDIEKYQLPLLRDGIPGAVPLRRLYVLEKSGDETPGGVSRLRGREALQALMAQTYRREYLAPLGLLARHFELCGKVAAETEVYRITRDWGFDVFEREFERVKAHIAA